MIDNLHPPSLPLNRMLRVTDFPEGVNGEENKKLLR